MITRLAGNPIVDPGMLAHTGDANVNGPALIRVPPWIRDPLGVYYLYFASHGGDHIRLAYADRLQGPWQVYRPGCLQLRDVADCHGHIASPDVIVDTDARVLRMYFHGLAKDAGRQCSFVALSDDGLSFAAVPGALGDPYFRVVRWNGWWLAVASGGAMYRSRNGLGDFERRATGLVAGNAALLDRAARVRHVALHLAGDALYIYFTRVGDNPERILRTRLRLAGDWNGWTAAGIEEILRPEMAWEGADVALAPSRIGPARAREHALRDPAIYEESDCLYLLYSVAGEAGIAIASLRATGRPAACPDDGIDRKMNSGDNRPTGELGG